MGHIRCSFRGGVIEAKAKTSTLPDLKGMRVGNTWRGILIWLSVLLFIRGYHVPGGITLTVAGLWSMTAMIRGNGRELYKRNRAMALLRKGSLEEALAIIEQPEPGSKLWWQLLGRYFYEESWVKAGQLLNQLKGEERDFLLAVALLGQGKAANALGLCPPRPRGSWKTLKAEVYFQQEEWKKLLGMVAYGEGKDKLEHIWLRGVSHYHLKQYKSAIRLLRRVVSKGGPDYGGAALLIERILSQIRGYKP